MHRAIPRASRVCDDRAAQQRLSIHRHKLRGMRPTSQTNARCGLDNRRPHTSELGHMRRNLKKEQLSEETQQRIERENKRLLGRMHQIMVPAGTKDEVEFVPGLRLSKDQVPRIDCHISQRSIMRGNAVKLQSMNMNLRWIEFVKLNDENITMLHRIHARQPNYSRRRDAKAWRKNRKLVKSLQNGESTFDPARSKRLAESRPPFSVTTHKWIPAPPPEGPKQWLRQAAAAAPQQAAQQRSRPGRSRRRPNKKKAPQAGGFYARQ